MITKVFEYSVAAAAAASNIMPSDFNPIPGDGLLDVSMVLDGGISGLTAPPNVQLIVGGATANQPVRTSSVTGSPYMTGAATSYADPVNVLVAGLPVHGAQNIQLLLAGGTGATATGRFRVTFRTVQEAQGGLSA